MTIEQVWTSLNKFGQVWTSLDKLGQVGTWQLYLKWTRIIALPDMYWTLYRFTSYLVNLVLASFSWGQVFDKFLTSLYKFIQVWTSLDKFTSLDMGTLEDLSTISTREINNSSIYVVLFLTLFDSFLLFLILFDSFWQVWPGDNIFVFILTYINSFWFWFWIMFINMKSYFFNLIWLDSFWFVLICFDSFWFVLIQFFLFDSYWMLLCNTFCVLLDSFWLLMVLIPLDCYWFLQIPFDSHWFLLNNIHS